MNEKIEKKTALMVAADVFVKASFVKGSGVRCIQRLVATAAVGCLGQVRPGNAVGGVAMGADNVQRIRHGKSLAR